MLGDRPILIKLGPVSLLGFLTALIAGSGWFFWMLNPQIYKSELKIIWPLILFCFYDLLGLLWSPLLISSIQDLVVWCGFLVLIMISAIIAKKGEKNIQTIFKVLEIGTWPLLMIAYYFVFTQNYRFAAIPILLLILLCFHLVKWKRGSRSSLFISLLILAVPLLTNARTPAAISLGLVVLVELIMNKKYKWLRVSIIGCVVVLVSVLLFIYYQPLRESFLQGDYALNIGGKAINTAGRISMWQDTIESFMKSPIFGTGMDAPMNVLTAGGQNHPHNDYLRLLHHLGIVGLLLWITFYVKAVKKVWEKWKYMQDFSLYSTYSQLYGTTFLALVAIALSMITDNTIVYSFVMYPLGILVGLSIVDLNKKET